MGETTQFTVRYMKEEDAAAVSKLHRKCFGKHGGARRNFFENAAWSWRYKSYVAEVEDKIVACAVAQVAEFFQDYRFDEIDSAKIIVLAVDPDYHGRGIGTAIFTELLDKLEETKIKNVSLQVHPGNTPAIEFYKHFGFRHLEIPRERSEFDVMALIMRYRCKTNLPSEQ